MNEEISVDIEVDVEQQEIPTEVKSDVLKGDKGDKGEKGDPTATIEINQVITGEPGTSVIIENVGTDVNMKLDITIPRGYKGDKPLKGIDYCTEEEKQELINEILSQVNQFSVEVVSELPIEEIRDTTIYFVPKENCKQRDVYDEYIYINNDWEHIGTTEIDLSNYYNKEEIDCKAQEMNSTVQEIDNKINNLSTVYTGTNITAPTCEGFGKTKKIYGYSNQATRSGNNKFALTTIKSSSSFQVTSTGINLKSCWTNDLYTYDELVKILKPNTAYTMKAKAKVVSRPSTILSHQYGTMLLYRPGSSSLESVATPVLQMADKETITLDTEKEYITTFTTPADLTDVRFLAYSFYGNNDGSTTGSAQGEIDLTEVMLVEGTYTTETFPEYELYGVSPSPDYPSKINNGADNINLFDLNTNKTSSKCAYNIVDDSVVVTNAGNWAYVNLVLSTEANKTYTLSAKYNNQDNSYVGLIARNANNEIIKRTEYVNNSNGELSLVFTATSNTSNINLYSNANANANTKVVTFSEIQLKEGSTVAPYSPYGQGSIKIKIQNEDKTQEQDMQITLAKPLYQGCYLAEDGIHYTRKQIVLDGSEDEGWSLSATNTSNQNRFTSKIIENEVKRPSNADEIANIICSHFIKESANETYRRSDGIAIHPNKSICLYYDAFKEYTISEFKTWLSNNPITLEYELAAEVINPYTDDISMFITQYDNKTNISNSDNAEMEIELTNNKTVSRINENAKTLQEEINNYKKSIREELLEQKEKIENKGKWVKLAETTSTTNEELNIDDLSKYTSLILQVLVSDSKNNVLQSTTGTVEQFKNSTFWQVGFSGNPTTYFVDCSYVSNTKVKMRSKSNADKGILWGII